MLAHLDIQVEMVMMDHQDHKVLRDNPDHQESQDVRDQEGIRDDQLWVHQQRPVIQVRLVNP